MKEEILQTIWKGGTLKFSIGRFGGADEWTLTTIEGESQKVSPPLIEELVFEGLLKRGARHSYSPDWKQAVLTDEALTLLGIPTKKEAGKVEVCGPDIRKTRRGR